MVLSFPPSVVATRMPVTQSTLERLGIRDLGTTLCTKPDIRVIASQYNIKQLQKFCEEHYQTRPTYNLVFSHPMTEIYVSGTPEQYNDFGPSNTPTSI